MSVRTTIFLLVCTLCFGVATSLGAVPPLISYQGRLTDGAGNPQSGDFNLTFTIYDDSISSEASHILWQESHSSVTAFDGLFNVILGAGTPATPINESVFTGTSRYLGIRVDSDPEIHPRTQLVSVTYSLQAGNADKVDGYDASQLMATAPSVFRAAVHIPTGLTTLLAPGPLRHITGIYVSLIGGGYCIFRINGVDILRMAVESGQSPDVSWNACGGAGLEIQPGETLEVTTNQSNVYVTVVGNVY